MRKLCKLFMAAFLLLSFYGCEQKIEKPMVVAANLWIGYSPLYYAYKKGWLEKNDIKFVATISLGQSLKYYKKGSFDIFAGTDYEYKQARKVIKDLTIVKLLDISKEGDLIYSNKSIDELKRSKKIEAYLEVDSLNYLLLEKFIKKYKLQSKQVKMINKREDMILNIKPKGNPVLIVVYKPYDRNLKREGYKVVATAKSLNFTIFDAFLVSKEYEIKNKQKINRLNFLFDKALKILKQKPNDFYIVINSYFGYKSYKDFKNAMKTISWKINKNLDYFTKQVEKQ